MSKHRDLMVSFKLDLGPRTKARNKQDFETIRIGIFYPSPTFKSDRPSLSRATAKHQAYYQATEISRLLCLTKLLLVHIHMYIFRNTKLPSYIESRSVMLLMVTRPLMLGTNGPPPPYLVLRGQSRVWPLETTPCPLQAVPLDTVPLNFVKLNIFPPQRTLSLLPHHAIVCSLSSSPELSVHSHITSLLSFVHSLLSFVHTLSFFFFFVFFVHSICHLALQLALSPLSLALYL